MKRYLLFSDLGILNGKYFARDFNNEIWKISEREARILEIGPENSAYKSTWEKVKSTLANIDGKYFRLEEDFNFNLFLIEA